MNASGKHVNICPLLGGGGGGGQAVEYAAGSGSGLISDLALGFRMTLMHACMHVEVIALAVLYLQDASTRQARAALPRHLESLQR